MDGDESFRRLRGHAYIGVELVLSFRQNVYGFELCIPFDPLLWSLKETDSFGAGCSFDVGVRGNSLTVLHNIYLLIDSKSLTNPLASFLTRCCCSWRTSVSGALDRQVVLVALKRLVRYRLLVLLSKSFIISRGLV